jgi:hypothetical protein
MLTNTELDFIRQNYQILGGTDCARKLNRSRHAVVTNAKAMGLDLTHEHRSNIMKRKLDKPFDERNVNPSSFIIPEQMDKVNAYLLGFIWADGHVSFKHSACRIEARFVTDDAPDILPLFRKAGKWGEYTATPPGCREATIVSTNNRPLAEFLNSMDYITKSSAPATKILNFIPQNLRRYWWLGCMDGDGCFSFGKIGQEIGIHSSYTQDWTHAEQLAKQLGIDYHLERRIAKRGKSSAIRIIKKESCSKFIHYLYPTGYEFGLCRKHQKATQMLERCESIHIVCPHCSGDIYLKCSDDVTCFHCKKDVYLNNFVKSRVLSLYSSSLPSTRQP